jgi:hypothetical protein
LQLAIDRLTQFEIAVFEFEIEGKAAPGGHYHRPGGAIV